MGHRNVITYARARKGKNSYAANNWFVRFMFLVVLFILFCAIAWNYYPQLFVVPAAIAGYWVFKFLRYLRRRSN
jgi:hypothetical protein